jgi:hypothetical protein
MFLEAKFTVSRDLVHSYVNAMIDADRRVFRVFLGDELFETCDFRVSTEGFREN